MEEKVLILNSVPRTFSNKDTGEVTDMGLVTYGIYVEDMDGFKGYAILECYCKAINLPIIDKYIGKIVPTGIKRRPNGNGFKYTLVSINGEKFE